MPEYPTPQVSIVIPMYNAKNTIEKTLAALKNRPSEILE